MKVLGQERGFVANNSHELGGGTDVLDPIMTNQVREIMNLLCFSIVGPIINFFGTVGNIINILVFVKMGFKETINISLLGLAVSDLCSLLFLQWFNICYGSFLEMLGAPFRLPDVRIISGGWPHIGFSRISGLLTAYITAERCLCVALPLKVKAILTRKTTIGVVVAIYAAVIAVSSPVYVVNKLDWKFYPALNKSLIGMVSTGNKVNVHEIMFASNIIYGVVPVIFVIFCTIILIKNILQNAKWRAKAASVGRNDASSKHSKGAMKDRRLVLMIATISSTFIVCMTPSLITFMWMLVQPGFNYNDRYENIHSFMASLTFLCEATHSSANFLIYLKMSSKYRAQFFSMFEHEDKGKKSQNEIMSTY